MANEVSVYLAWWRAQHLPRLAGSPAFVSPGGKPRVYLAWRLFHSSRSRQHRPGGLKPTLHKPCVYLAWRRDQPLSRLAESPAFTSLGGLSRTQYVSRLAAFREPSVYPAWRPFTSPVFIPLGGLSRVQCLSRLAAIMSPVSIPLGGLLRAQYSSRLAAFREPSVYPAWRSFANPVFVPLDGAHHSASNRSTI